jgi:hypothetical protein
MTYKGHIKNGTVVLDQPVALPEGAEVNVDLHAGAFEEFRFAWGRGRRP